jgi:hypothetical protein
MDRSLAKSGPFGYADVEQSELYNRRLNHGDTEDTEKRDRENGRGSGSLCPPYLCGGICLMYTTGD